MGKRVFITGVAGFIGSSLADTMLEHGFNIMGIDNFDPFYDRTIKENNIKNAQENTACQFIEGDIRDRGFIDKCFSEFKPEVVVHLAAKAGVRPSLTDPSLYFDVNVMGTLNILEMMKKNNIGKMVFASSSSVYGNNSKVPFSETDNVDYPISPYAASKKAGELLCHTYSYLNKMDITCLRFFTVYGPRQRPDLAISKFLKAILKSEPITIYGDGTTSRDYTYIDDILQGISGAVKNLNGFNIFNLGESKPVSLADLVALMEKVTGMKPRLIHMPVQEGDVLRTYADITKAKKFLDYCPEIEIETGMRYFLEWLKKESLSQ